MLSKRQITKKYSFPSVNVTEIVRGPVNQNVQWRNVIGVAAPFTKGPKLARISNSRKDFIALYGEDQSIGSMFVQQAMLQGASEFIISRVLPENQSAMGTILLVPPSNFSSQETRVSEFGPRTIGLKFKTTFISDFQLAPGSFTGVQSTSSSSNSNLEVFTNSHEQPLIEFSGLGYVDILGREIVSIENLIQENILSNRQFKIIDAVAVTDKIFKIKFNSTATIVNSQTDQLDQLIRSIKPGFNLIAGANITLGTDDLQVLSYVNNVAINEYEVLVKGTINSVSTNPTLVVTGPAGSVTGSYTLIGVQLRSLNNQTLPQLPLNINNNFVSYIQAPHNSLSALVIPITYYTLDTDIIEVDTGIKIAFGKGGTGVISRVSPRIAGTISFFNNSVIIGESGNFPDSENAFRPGTNVIDIYQKLKDTIMSDPTLSNLINSVEVNTSSLPYSLSFELENSTSLGNNVKYSVELIKSNISASDLNLINETGGLVNSTSLLNMVGGVDPMTTANITLYDLTGNSLVYIEALSPGRFGNNIRLNVRPVTEGEFILEVFSTSIINSTTLPSETFYLSNRSANLDNGVYPDTLSSNYIRAYFIPLINNNQVLSESVFNRGPARLAPPDFTLMSAEDIRLITHPNHRGESYLTNISLSGGSEPVSYPSDGTSFDEEDYIKAIQRLKEEDVVIISAPGITAGDYRFTRAIKALVDQAEESTPYEGLRLAIVSTPRRLSLSRAQIIAKNFSSERVVLLSGYARVDGYLPGITLNSTEGLYAGYLVNLQPHISPAATVGRGVSNISSLDQNNTLDVLDTFTKLNIEVLHLDPVTKQFKFLNGRNTSGESVVRWISIRRYADHIIMNLFRNLQWAKALPNDESLRSRIASSCDAFLLTERSQGFLTAFSPTISDESINSEIDIATGNLNILLRYVPKFPADYINLAVVRDFSTQFSLDLNI